MRAIDEVAKMGRSAGDYADEVIALRQRIAELEAENCGLRNALKIAIDAVNGVGGVTVREINDAAAWLAKPAN